MAKLKTLVYQVANDDENNITAKNITASLSVAVDKHLIEPQEAILELHAMKTLFYRLSTMNLKEELNFNNDILYELFEGILKTISKEFDHINSCLFSFIEKMMKIKSPNTIVAVELIGKELPNKIKLLNVEVHQL